MTELADDVKAVVVVILDYRLLILVDNKGQQASDRVSDFDVLMTEVRERSAALDDFLHLPAVVVLVDFFDGFHRIDFEFVGGQAVILSG